MIEERIIFFLLKLLALPRNSFKWNKNIFIMINYYLYWTQHKYNKRPSQAHFISYIQNNPSRALVNSSGHPSSSTSSPVIPLVTVTGRRWRVQSPSQYLPCRSSHQRRHCSRSSDSHARHGSVAERRRCVNGGGDVRQGGASGDYGFGGWSSVGGTFISAIVFAVAGIGAIIAVVFFSAVVTLTAITAVVTASSGGAGGPDGALSGYNAAGAFEDYTITVVGWFGVGKGREGEDEGNLVYCCNLLCK